LSHGRREQEVRRKIMKRRNPAPSTFLGGLDSIIT
jgi:hypothetical protein